VSQFLVILNALALRWLNLIFLGVHLAQFEWLLLHWKKSDGLATSLIYWAMDVLFKIVALIDIGVTIATQ